MDANANNIEATFDVETVELSSEFDIEQQNFDALFEINAAGTTWGSIDGDIENQADLIAILNTKATNEALTALATTVTNNYTTLDTKIDGVQLDLSGNISVLETAVQNEATTRANNDILLQNGINTLTSNLSAEISNRATADNTLQSDINSLSNTVTNNYTTLDGKITTINNTLSDYGNIVTHNVAEFATATQGLLADTALQPNDNISELNNNVGYITGISSADVTNALGYTPYNATNPNGYISGINSTDVVTALGYTPYDSSNPDGYITSASLPTVNNNTITIQKNNTDVGSFTLNQSSNDTINITVPTDTNDLTNGAGFITSAALPTLSDLATNTQMAAIDSGATAEKIDQINTNTGDISNEIINRQNADNALQSQIDAIVASSDVFDIVGTYAELQAYDITTVPVNDIIKVLVDSTHNNAATYYRCVENNNVKSWSYIGSEGAYYTKGEADSKFVEQTITINGQPLSSNVTLTASDVNALPSSTTIGAGVLTVQKNGTTIDTFGANDTGNTTINITVPTDTGDLTNNAGFITGITGTDVTNALGYTPYDSSNPSGYTSNIGTVTSVNNISPVSGNVTLSIPSATSDLTNDSGFLTSSDLTGYGQLSADQNWTGVNTFVGDKRIKFKQAASNNKLGFTLYDNNNNEKGYLEFNPSNTIDNAPLMTLGNYATSTSSIAQVGFRRYSSVSGANGAYNLLTPLIADAKTPFNLTTTYTNFYLPLGFTDGVTTVTTAKSGLVDLSSILPNSAVWGNITGTLSNQTDLNNALGDKQDTLVSGTNIKTINNTSILGSGNISINADNIFIATYGTTTFADVLAAWTAGKTIYAKRTINPISSINDYIYYALINYSDNSISDTFKFSNCTGKIIYTVALKDDNTWSIASDTLIANTATGSNSLTILGTAASGIASINIGSSSTASRSNSVAIGNSANTISQYSVAIGYNAKAGTDSDSSYGAVAIGYNAGGDYSKGNTVAIGNNAVAKSTGSIAIGDSAEVGNTNYTNGIAIGEGSQVYGANSINLGYGANTTANTLSVGFYGQNSDTPYTLLDGTTGLIPEERIGTFTNSINSTAINPLVVKVTGADITTAPSSDIDTGILFKDVNDNNLAGFTTTRFTNGTQATSISAINNISGTSKTAHLNVYVDGSGDDHCDASAGVKKSIAQMFVNFGTSYAISFDASGNFTPTTNGFLQVSVTSAGSGSIGYLATAGLNISLGHETSGFVATGIIPAQAGVVVHIDLFNGAYVSGATFIPNGRI